MGMASELRHASTDRAAEEQVCRRFARRIWAYGIRHLRDHAQAADLVQQVLVVVLEALRDGRVREPEKIESFVLGTCRYAVLDLNRAGRRRDAALERYVREIADAVVPPPEITDPTRLMQCLRALDHRMRRVL